MHFLRSLTTIAAVLAGPAAAAAVLTATVTQTICHDMQASAAAASPIVDHEVIKSSKTYLQSSAAPTATLMPNPYRGTKDGCEVLKPTSSIKFFYSDPSPVASKPQAIAYIDWNFTAPAVPLEHTDYISSIKCGTNEITISFNNKTAYKTVVDSWPLTSKFILVGACSGSNATRDYHLISSVTHDTKEMTAHCQAQEIELKDACQRGKVVWGNYSPNSTASAVPSASVSSPATVHQTANDGYVNLESQVQTFYRKLLGKTRLAFRQTRAVRSQKKSLVQRGFFDDIGNFFDNVGNTIENAVNDVVDGVETVFSTAATLLQAAGQVITSGKANVDFPLGSLSIALPPPGLFQLVDTPFNEQGFVLEQFEGGTLFCIDCVVTGGIAFSGSAEFSITDGIESANLNADGNLHVGFQLGLVAQASFTHDFTQNLYSINLAGLEIPNIISVGPQLTVAADLKVTAGASGQIRAGFALDWNAAHAGLDLLNPSASDQSGWSPVYTPVFDAEGKVELGADLSLPVTLSFGINILGGLFNKQVGIVEKPGFYVDATLQGEVHLIDGDIEASFGETNTETNLTCLGISIIGGFANHVFIEVDGASVLALSDITLPLFESCIQIGSQEGPAPDTSSGTSTIASTATDSPESISDSSSSTTSSSAVYITPASVSATSVGVYDTLSSTVVTSTVTSLTSTIQYTTSTATATLIYTTIDSFNHSTAITTTSCSSTIISSTIYSTATNVYSTTSYAAATATSSTSSTSSTSTSTSTPYLYSSSIAQSTSSVSSSAAASPSTYTIKSSDDGSYLKPAADGSVTTDSSSSSYVSLGDTGYAIGDADEQRIFHYNQDDMTKDGVSQLELHRASHCPVSAVPVVLSDKATGSVKALSSSGASLDMITCTINGVKKVFVASDSAAAIMILQMMFASKGATSCQATPYTMV